jgi:hypothetical protein
MALKAKHEYGGVRKGLSGVEKKKEKEKKEARYSDRIVR